MKHCNKKLLARVLCLFFVFSAFGGGLLSSGKWLGEGQSYAIDELLTAGEHEVNPEDGEILDEDGITESGMEDGANVDVEEKTEDEDTVKAENAEGQEKRSKRMIALSDESIEPQADGDTGDFVVTGGTYGVDYEYKDVSYKNLTYGTNESTAEDAKPPHTAGSHAAWTQKSLVIKSNKSLTVSTKQQTNAGIYIAPGVQADLTFAGVDIRAYLPVNIASNTGREQGAAYDSNPVSISGESTSLHLTLADESTNTLTCITDGDYTIQAPGIRCGEGSKLVIDDGRRNVDQNGQPVLPKDGKVSRDATLADGTVVKAGDRLTILDSAKPGKLTVNGGYRAAAIGGGPIENSGDMTFNGGMIKAYAFGPYNDLYGAGAGIGGGHAGGGTQITINGGDIEAEGSVHGAGVGGGCTYARGMSPTTTYAFSDAILCKTPSSTIAGNININGGYIKAKGFQHGNAFGQGCAGTNKGKKIVITGGTLLPTSQNGTDAAGSPLCDVGGREGNVIVTGGSIRLTDNNPNKFQGTGWSNVAMTEDVFRITIDLSGEKIDGKPVENNAIAFWSLSIGGVECDYGAPSYFDDGKLYLWLPRSAENKEIKVNVSAMSADGNGEPKELEPLFVQNANGSGNSLLKRYVEFEMPEAYSLKQLTKDYDGNPFTALKLEDIENEIKDSDGNVTEIKAGLYTGTLDDKYLTDTKAVDYKVLRYDKINGEPLPGQSEISLKGNMPSDAGIYKLTMTSDEYTKYSDFSKSYWGHRATGWAIINKIPAELTDAYYDIEYGQAESKENPGEMETVVTQMKFRAAVKQGKEKRKTTCAAPDGYVQFYVNGVKVGAPVAVTTSGTPEEGGYAYGTVNATIDFTNDATSPAIPRLDSGKFIVNAVYYDGTNYLGDETPVKPEPVPEGGTEKPDEPENFPYINPPIPVIPASGDKPTGEEEPKGTKLNPEDIERIEDKGDLLRLHGKVSDKISRKVEKKVLSETDLVEELNQRYVFVGLDGKVLNDGNKPIGITSVEIKDSNGAPIDEIDLSKPGKYTLETTVTDAKGNQTTITVAYNVTKPILINPDINKDTNDDGKPDLNIDKDGDGIPETNIDTNGDDKPDVNIDTDDDGKPDVNIDTDGDGKPDINIDTDGDGKPDVDIDTNDDGKPDVNIDTDGDGKPDINKDTDGDGKPDVDIDTDGDGKPDINKDADGDGKPDVDIDTNGDGKPDVNIDTDGDGKPDINKDTNGDGKPDVDIDTDGDGKPDVNIDTDGDGKPDINIDKNGDGKPDVNIDTDGDGKPDVNIDTDGDGKPDLNVDTDGDGIPDVNIDTDGDGKPDKNIVKKDELPGWTDNQNGGDKNGDKTDELPWWIPRTGDTASMITWIAILGGAIAALSAALSLKKRNNTK